MRLIFCILLLLFTTLIYSQKDGEIVSRTPYVLPMEVVEQVTKSFDSKMANRILNLRYSRIVYYSDGLKVKAYIVEPAKKGKYPCIISNRGGNRSFGEWNATSIALFLGLMASWDYVVIASQYRGNDGGEGVEEFGGADVNDVLNLVPVLAQVPSADTSRLGMEGTSRGGMMTYLSLSKSCLFRAAAITGGVADLVNNIKRRPEMEANVCAQLIPNYEQQKEDALQHRSVVYWPGKLCSTTPLLIMHGSADWRVNASESLELVNKLQQLKHPVRFILFEGADHGLTEVWTEAMEARKRHFDRYIKEKGKMPNMQPHGQ